MDKRLSLFFSAPREIEINAEPIPSVDRGEVLVKTELSAISPGTEMLFYRDQVPADLPVDATFSGFSETFAYPLKYGYALIGQVEALGEGVNQKWLGRRVFVFHPHETHFVTKVANLHPVPAGIPSTSAVLLPFMETAVSFLMDAQPLIGERTVLLGQGIVGLLTTALLARYPLSRLITLDHFPLRRQWSLKLGAEAALDPAESDVGQQLQALLAGAGSYQGADLIFELSGNPQALDLAVTAAGYDGRVLIGSWYGRKKANLNLGGRFHRSRIRLISSQVSHIAPPWRGRFDQQRRLNVAWSMMVRIDPSRLVTQRVPISRAPEAYRLLDEEPGSAIQVLLTYD